jgi:hypothetical protein
MQISIATVLGRQTAATTASQAMKASRHASLHSSEFRGLKPDGSVKVIGLLPTYE